MRRRAAIAAAVLSASSVAARAQGVGVSGQVQADGEVELTADRILYDWETRKLELDGHVVARRGPQAVLQASDQAGFVHLTGKVHASNLGMRALYRKFGFEATHITMERRPAPGSPDPTGPPGPAASPGLPGSPA